MTKERREVGELLKDLVSPLEAVRLSSLKALARQSDLAALRAMRRAATGDPSPMVRAEARRILTLVSNRLSGGHLSAGLGTDVAMDRCRSLLADPDPMVRAKVIAALGLSFDPRAGGLLDGALDQERDSFVLSTLVSSVAATLGGSAVSRLTRFLQHRDPRVRAATIDALGTTGDPEVLRLVLPLLEDGHTRVRVAVLKALRSVEPDAVLRCVDSMLSGVDEVAIHAALFVLRHFDPSIAVPRLAGKLEGTAPGLREMALSSLRALAQRGSKRARRALAAAQASPFGTAPAGITDPLARVVAQPIEARLSSESVDERHEALRQTAQDGRTDLLPQLREWLALEKEPRVLATLLATVGQLGGTEDVERLVPFLEHEAPRVRSNAVEALGRLDAVRSAPLITPFLSDRSNRVRANAIVALSEVPGVDVMPALSRMAASSNITFAMSAIWAAATIATPATVEILATLLRHRTSRVCDRARAALEALAPVIGSAADALATLASRPAAAAGDGGDQGDLDSSVSTMQMTRSGIVLGGPAFDLGPLSGSIDLPSAALTTDAKSMSSFPLASIPTEEYVQKILFDLKHESAEVRLETVHKAANLGHALMLEPIAELLFDVDPAVRSTARQAIRTLIGAGAGAGAGGAGASASDALSPLEEFETALGGGKDEARQALRSTLAVAHRCGAAATVKVLAARLPLAEDAHLRAGILSMVALIGDDTVAPMLQAFVRDPDARVRANAIDGLAVLGYEPALKIAVASLADPDPRVRAAAISASMSMYREPFLTHLRTMLRSETREERSAGLHALVSVSFQEREDLLRDYLRTEAVPPLYEKAATVLFRESPPESYRSLEELVRGLDDDSKRVALEAMLRRSKEADPGLDGSAVSRRPVSAKITFDDLDTAKLTVAEIRSRLTVENHPEALLLLLEAAIDRGVSDATELARPLLAAPDRKIRLAALDLLARVQGGAVHDAFASLVADRDDDVSRRALEILEGAAPERALQEIDRLLATGRAWSVRRGLAFLEGRGAAVGLPRVVALLGPAPQPVLMEPLTRMVLSWGDRATLERLSALFSEAPANARPFLLELGTGLSRRLGIEAGERVRLFPSGSTASSQRIERLARSLPLERLAGWLSARARALPVDRVAAWVSKRSGTLAKAGAGAAVVVVLLLVFMSGEPPPLRPVPPLPTLSAPPPLPPPSPVASIRVTEEPARTVSIAFAPMDLPAPREGPPPEPTLEEVEDRLRVAYASKGIRSKAILHLMAVERVSCSYRTEIQRARDAFDGGRFDEAIGILEATLEHLPPDHLGGRLSVLRALVIICRESGRFDRMDRYRAQLGEVQKSLVDTAVQAAREGGLPEDNLRTLLARFEETEKHRAASNRATDWLSGAKLFTGPEEPGGK